MLIWQKLGKNHAILELFLGNSSWQIDERQNLCAPPAGGSVTEMGKYRAPIIYEVRK